MAWLILSSLQYAITGSSIIDLLFLDPSHLLTYMLRVYITFLSKKFLLTNTEFKIKYFIIIYEINQRD